MSFNEGFLGSIPCGAPCETCPVRGLPFEDRVVVDIATKNLDPETAVNKDGTPSKISLEFVGDVLYFGANGQPRDPEKIEAVARAIARVTREECLNY